MKKYLALLLFALSISTLRAQTNVSGGIYTNTTWTLANSPYIVTDTVVIFPGVTLTIEPGVTVKFDDGLFLEIRNGTLIAAGTSSDSIIFTSNSAAPAPGIWGGGNAGIWINGVSPASTFSFCRIEYATTGINSPPFLKNSVFLNNSTGIYSLSIPTDSCIFRFNNTAVYNLHTTINNCDFSNNTYAFAEIYGSTLNHCRLDSNATVVNDLEHSNIFYSSISYNQNGVRTHVGSGTLIKYCTINYNANYGITFEPGDTVTQCEIKYNGTGINLAGHVGYGGHQVSYCDIEFNSIGIYASSNPSIASMVTKCDISNNDVGIKITSTAVNIYCNRICNSAAYGLQMNTSAPFDVSNNFWCTTDSASTAAIIYDGYDNVTYGLVTFLPADTSLCFAPAGIAEQAVLPTVIFPNPTAGKFVIGNLSPGKNVLQILNPLGEIVYSEKLSSEADQVINAHLAAGIYFVEVVNEKEKLIGKLIIE